MTTKCIKDFYNLGDRFAHISFYFLYSLSTFLIYLNMKSTAEMQKVLKAQNSSALWGIFVSLGANGSTWKAPVTSMSGFQTTPNF